MSTTQLVEDSTYHAHDVMVLNLWDTIHLTDQLNQCHKNQNQVVYLEGPPFISGSGKCADPTTKKEASGLHAGHCLVSEIKSCIIKYLHMTGHKCYPYTGTDNHGLPIETFVSKLLNLSSPTT